MAASKKKVAYPKGARTAGDRNDYLAAKAAGKFKAKKKPSKR